MSQDISFSIACMSKKKMKQPQRLSMNTRLKELQVQLSVENYKVIKKHNEELYALIGKNLQGIYC